MDFPVPIANTNENITKTASNIKKYGIWRYLFLKLIENPIYLLALVIFLIWNSILQKQISKTNNFMSNLNSQSQQTQTVQNVTLSSEAVTEAKIEPVKGSKTGFNPQDWVIEKFNEDSEGYLCPTSNKFPYLSIWSKDTYPIEYNTEMRIMVKNVDKKQKDSPTILITYGDYSEKFHAPQNFYYKLYIFDEGKNFIRLYNENDKPVETDVLKSVPSFKSQLLIKLNTKIANPGSGRLFVNPELSYIPMSIESAKTENYQPENEFSIQLASPSINNSLRSRLGIGTRQGSCIKIVSLE